MIPRKSSGALEWNECRRLVSRLGANLDVVVRSDAAALAALDRFDEHWQGDFTLIEHLEIG